MPQEILDQLARLAELTNPELNKLQQDIVKEFDKVDKIKDKSAGDVELLESLAQANDSVVAEGDSRAEANAAAEARAAELRDKMHPSDTTPPAPVDAPADEADAEDEDEEEDEEVDTPEAIAAAAANKTKLPSLSKLNSRRQLKPTVQTARASTRTVAQFQSAGLKMGDRIESRDQFDRLMYDKVFDLTRVKGTGEKFVVASMYTDYPEDRQLHGDAGENEHKIKAVSSREAIIASGGVCGPVAVDYDILILSSAAEPLGDSLPKFSGDRGGVRFVQPPSFAGVGTSATSLWTAATDANPGVQTKPIQTISCGNVVEVFVNAIPTRLKFGNMQGRYFPELIAANTDLAIANAARVKELNRLSTISTNSTLVSSGQLLGASRDILATLDLACAAQRYRSRLDRTVSLRAIFPDWTKDMFRADLTRELAHTQEPGWNTLGLTDEELTALLSDRGVNVTWMLDGQAAVTAAPAQKFQGWGAQAANNVLVDWPTNLVWWLFPEGTFQLLDGGQMDFGVIRDSTLDATNDYEMMIEVFENVIYRGFESLQIVSQVRPNGESAAGITTGTASVY